MPAEIAMPFKMANGIYDKIVESLAENHREYSTAGVLSMAKYWRWDLLGMLLI